MRKNLHNANRTVGKDETYETVVRQMIRDLEKTLSEDKWQKIIQ